jgi:hypothetical protein
MSKQSDADLILKLYDLRREEVMRKARNWVGMEFNPTSAQDLLGAMMGPNSAYFRMVVSYWDMAASLVNNGAIDEQMFNDANGEHIFIYAKLEPFIAEFRTLTNMSNFLAQVEKLIARQPNGAAEVVAMRERIKAMMSRRESAASGA